MPEYPMEDSALRQLASGGDLAKRAVKEILRLRILVGADPLAPPEDEDSTGPAWCMTLYCLKCGWTLTFVRPGKWRCENCKQD